MTANVVIRSAKRMKGLIPRSMEILLRVATSKELVNALSPRTPGKWRSVSRSKCQGRCEGCSGTSQLMRHAHCSRSRHQMLFVYSLSFSVSRPQSCLDIIPAYTFLLNPSSPMNTIYHHLQKSITRESRCYSAKHPYGPSVLLRDANTSGQQSLVHVQLWTCSLTRVDDRKRKFYEMGSKDTAWQRSQVKAAMDVVHCVGLDPT
jgi:hypothetical protein